MPLYQYKCKVCDKEEEVIQKYNDAAPIHCEKPMERQLAGGQGLLFKGSGFYKTDYRK